MLRSPKRRVAPALTSGGGAITAAWGAERFRDSFLSCSSGGGATGERSIRGARREISETGTAGAGPIGIGGLSRFSNNATTLGKAMSLRSWMFGGVTMVCEWLSASGGTEIMG
jgi:hypothetical protein